MRKVNHLQMSSAHGSANSDKNAIEVVKKYGFRTEIEYSFSRVGNDSAGKAVALTRNLRKIVQDRPRRREFPRACI